MMKVRYLLFCLVLLFAISCKTKQTEKHKIFMLLFDISQSTKQEEMLKNYMDNYKQVQSKFKEGDILVAGLITEKSISELSFPINYSFPVFEASTDNTLYMTAEKKKFDSTQTKIKDSLNALIDTLIHSRRNVMQTDIFSSLQLAEKVFNSYSGYNKVLVIMSDMVESIPSCDFDKETLSEQKINAIIKKNEKSNIIPDLSDVKVYIAGAYYANAEKYNQIQNFWIKYFVKCKANFTKNNYNSALINFNE